MGSANKTYTLLDHTADIGIEVHGKTFKSILEKAAFAVFDIISGIEQVTPRLKIEVSLHKMTHEEMMRYWLEYLLMLFNTKDMLLSRFRISQNNNDQLIGEAWGEVYNPRKHLIHTEIKGLTYHQFKVHQINNNWVAKMIFDV